MTEDELIDRIDQSKLPRAVKRHLIRCIQRGRRNRWHLAMEEDFDRVVEATLKLVILACGHTGRDPDSLLRDTDFDPSDLDPDRLDSAIGELRGINHLAKEGFSDLRLLRAQPGTRTADLVALRNMERYALDVACSSARAERDLEDLPGYMLGVCRLKAAQLANTVEAEGCQRSGVVFVINSFPALIFGYEPLYRRAAREVHEAMGSPANYHVVIVTGRIAHVAGGPKGYFEGADDVVCPSWP